MTYSINLKFILNCFVLMLKLLYYLRALILYRAYDTAKSIAGLCDPLFRPRQQPASIGVHKLQLDFCDTFLYAGVDVSKNQFN